MLLRNCFHFINWNCNIFKFQVSSIRSSSDDGATRTGLLRWSIICFTHRPIPAEDAIDDKKSKKGKKKAKLIAPEPIPGGESSSDRRVAKQSQCIRFIKVLSVICCYKWVLWSCFVGLQFQILFVHDGNRSFQYVFAGNHTVLSFARNSIDKVEFC